MLNAAEGWGKIEGERYERCLGAGVTGLRKGLRLLGVRWKD